MDSIVGEVAITIKGGSLGGSLGGPGASMEEIVFLEVCRKVTSTETFLPAPNSATSCRDRDMDGEVWGVKLKMEYAMC